MSTLSEWIGDRFISDGKETPWFRSKYGSIVEFFSLNDEKNESQPVLNIQQFDNEGAAREAAKAARAYWGRRASVRFHERRTKVDSIALAQWFVVTRAYPDRRDLEAS